MKEWNFNMENQAWLIERKRNQNSNSEYLCISFSGMFWQYDPYKAFRCSRKKDCQTLLDYYRYNLSKQSNYIRDPHRYALCEHIFEEKE